MLPSNGRVCNRLNVRTNNFGYFWFFVGVISKYFAPRWKLFVEYANETLTSGVSFDQSYISGKIFDEVELPFTYDESVLPVVPIGEVECFCVNLT